MVARLSKRTAWIFVRNSAPGRFYGENPSYQGDLVQHGPVCGALLARLIDACAPLRVVFFREKLEHGCRKLDSTGTSISYVQHLFGQQYAFPMFSHACHRSAGVDHTCHLDDKRP